jgi:hypothetical protein
MFRGLERVTGDPEVTPKMALCPDWRPSNRNSQLEAMSDRLRGAGASALGDRARGPRGKPVGTWSGALVLIPLRGRATRNGPTVTEERSDEHLV